MFSIGVIAKFTGTDYFPFINATAYEALRLSDEPWLILVGQEKEEWTLKSFKIFKELHNTFPDFNLGYVDIYTKDGELIKVTLDQQDIPWTYYVSSHSGTRKAYRFNGFDNTERLSKFLKNATLWD